MILSDEAKQLLDERGLFVMPQEINHDVFKLVVYVCALYEDKPLAFHSQGDGGDSTATLGIIDVIRQHGRVTGLLAGEANSCSGLIFAACVERYVYPYGSIGIHACGMAQINDVHGRYAQFWADDLTRVDQIQAEILAEACDTGVHNAAFWLDVIVRRGRDGLQRVDAKALVACGIAKPIEARPK
jgi:ATP-dependent protease ClpP protease subunit